MEAGRPKLNASARAPSLDRREAMTCGLVTIGGLAWAAGCGSSMPDRLTPGIRELGAVSAYPLGAWRLEAANQLVIGHDAGGLFAYSALCTHEGCLIDPPDATGQSLCECHGSIFDGEGAVVQGPARTPLQHYQVTVAMGVVSVDTSKTVSAGARTPV